jgi:hypothetical protein
MKRVFLALFLVLITAAAAYAVFLKVRPNGRFECEMQWLSKKLSLSPEQAQRVRALHYQYCPTLNGLCSKTKATHDASQQLELKQRCNESTRLLVEKVCAELTEEQRTQYLKLVESCSRPKDAAKP